MEHLDIQPCTNRMSELVTENDLEQMLKDIAGEVDEAQAEMELLKTYTETRLTEDKQYRMIKTTLMRMGIELIDVITACTTTLIAIQRYDRELPEDFIKQLSSIVEAKNYVRGYFEKAEEN